MDDTASWLITLPDDVRELEQDDYAALFTIGEAYVTVRNRWLALRKKIRPYGEFDGQRAWYIDGQVIGLGDDLDEAVDALIASVSPPENATSK